MVAFRTNWSTVARSCLNREREDDASAAGGGESGPGSGGLAGSTVGGSLRGGGDRRRRSSRCAIVLRAPPLVAEDPVRLRQFGGAHSRHLLEFLPEVVDLIRMISSNLLSKGPLDLFK